MKHVGEIKTGKNVQQVRCLEPQDRSSALTLPHAQVLLRALQFSNSEPKGPSYVYAYREVTEEHLIPKEVPDVRTNEIWSPLEPSPLNKSSALLPNPLRGHRLTRI